MKKVVQVLLDPTEYEAVRDIAEQDASSSSAAGRKLIRMGLETARKR